MDAPHYASDAPRYTRYAPLALAILIAAVLQAVLIARSPTVGADGIIFTTIARDLTTAPIDALHKHDQHPGFPAAMLVATRLVQTLGYHDEPQAWMAGGRAVAFVCGLLSVWVVWLLTRDLFDAQVANFAALAFAVLPIPRINASDAQSDTPHLLFYLTAAWLASSALKPIRKPSGTVPILQCPGSKMGLSPSPRRFSDRHLVHGGLLRLAAAGLASAIAYWIRPEGLEVVLVAMICLVWQGFRANWPWRRMALSGAALAGTALLVAAPYPILAGKITSKQIPFAKAQPVPTFISQQAEVRPNVPAQPNVDTQPGVNVQPSVGVQPKDEVCPAMALPSPAVAPDAVVARPVQPETRYSAGLVVRLAGKALASLVVSICQGLKFAFIPLYLLGQWELVRRKPDWFTIGFLWFLAILHMLILLGVYFLSGYIAHRHVLPLVGLAMPFVALGIVGAGEKLAWICKVQPRHAALATLLVCTALVLPYSLRPYNREFLPVIAATKWVQQHAEPGEGIVCNSPYVAFYGTLPTTVLGPEGPSLDLALAKAPANTRFDYVVLHVGAYDYRPEWQTQVEERYRQVLCLPDPYATTRVRKVLVFESKDRQARKAASRSPS